MQQILSANHGKIAQLNSASLTGLSANDSQVSRT
jgi:hypothetical protein